eukprot:TRINITY_DN523_c1_g1_i2.p1 TRINITY_DN523_c1_g1~~TRINITY_DN523_c1_g1_i2.p1  ORF type:complete len:358 (-),score=91.37 TRINITY_DN523_c1_g1_i2:41-1114(-)
MQKSFFWGVRDFGCISNVSYHKGLSSAGKSTFIRQMQLMYGELNDDERRTYSEIIRHNLILGMIDIAEFVDHNELAVQEKNRRMIRKLRETKYDLDLLDEKNKEGFLLLWKDPVVQSVKGMETVLDKSPNISYFMEKFEEIADKDYMPTDDDIIRARQKTTGTVTATFDFDAVTWTINDVGGQMTERKKWDAIIQDQMRVLFFVAVNEYNILSSELPDGTEEMTRLDFSRTVFLQEAENIMERGEELQLIIVFLNKIDLFEEKMKTDEGYNEFYEQFPEFDEIIPKKKKVSKEKDIDEVIEQALEHVSHRFIEDAPPELNLVFHLCCALDKDMLGIIMKAVQSCIMENYVAASGLVI